MRNPAVVLAETMQAINGLYKAVRTGGLPKQTLELVHLRVSQINGCSPCVDAGARSAKKAGVKEEQLFALAAWRETPYFSDAERAALALAEAPTRLNDRADPVPDSIWDAAAKHYDERQLAALVLWIATANLFNRVNATTRQPAPRAGAELVPADEASLRRRDRQPGRGFATNLNRVPASGEKPSGCAPRPCAVHRGIRAHGAPWS